LLDYLVQCEQSRRKITDLDNASAATVEALIGDLAGRVAAEDVRLGE